MSLAKWCMAIAMQLVCNDIMHAADQATAQDITSLIVAVPANAPKAKACGLLGREEQHFNGSFWLEAGVLKALDSCNGSNHPKCSII